MNDTRVSRRLSYLLRHSRDPLYVDLHGGWANVKDILSALQITPADLERIVAEDEKGRYSFDDCHTHIRANQGHSIPDLELEMAQPEPPEFLYHGTATRFLDAIMAEGLKPMTRLWVHLSDNLDTAMVVGKRHGTPVVLVMRARDFVADGHELYRSANGVWQARAVPREYLTVYYG